MMVQNQTIFNKKNIKCLKEFYGFTIQHNFVKNIQQQDDGDPNLF